MQMRNDRTPKGADMGPASAFIDERYIGSLVEFARAQAPNPRRGLTQDKTRLRRREQWRESQQRRRDRAQEARMSGAPEVRGEIRVKHTRASITVPRDIDAWVRWRAESLGVPMSAVYADAVRMYVEFLRVSGDVPERVI